MTQQMDWGRLARITVVGGMSCALVLALLWLAIVWLNGIQPVPPPPP